MQGIFHTHAHDDHFPGLTSLVRSERRLAYYAVPWVRASVQKKLSSLMRVDESRFHRFFDVHDLVTGAWNTIGDIEAKPVYFPTRGDHNLFWQARGMDAGSTPISLTFLHSRCWRSSLLRPTTVRRSR